MNVEMNNNDTMEEESDTFPQEQSNKPTRRRLTRELSSKSAPPRPPPGPDSQRKYPSKSTRVRAIKTFQTIISGEVVSTPTGTDHPSSPRFRGSETDPPTPETSCPSENAPDSHHYNQHSLRVVGRAAIATLRIPRIGKPSTSSRSVDVVVKISGMLWKEPNDKLGGLSHWRRRWFELQQERHGAKSSVILYFEDSTKAKSRGSILMENVISVQHLKDYNFPPIIRSSRGFSSGAFGFELKTRVPRSNNTRHFVLIAPDQIKGSKWLQCIEMCINNNVSQKPEEFQTITANRSASSLKGRRLSRRHSWMQVACEGMLLTVAFDVYSILEKDDFFMHTRIKHVTACLDRLGSLKTPTGEDQCEFVDLFDWNERSMYTQGTIRNDPSIRDALSEKAYSLGKPLHVVLIATIIIQRTHYWATLRKYTSTQRGIVKDSSLKLNGLLKKWKKDKTVEPVFVGRNIDVVIANTVDLVKSQVIYDPRSEISSQADDIRRTIVSGICGSHVVSAPDVSFDERISESGEHQEIFLEDEADEINQNEVGNGQMFKEFAPVLFKRLRLHFGVSSKEFVKSLKTGVENLGAGAGRSGCIFFVTQDRSFIIKSVSKAESTVLRNFLVSYYNHVTTYVNTLLTRFYGIYMMKVSGRKIRFVIMNNVFGRNIPNEAYDLKGSSVNRSTMSPAEARGKSGVVMKDMDLDKQIQLDKTLRLIFVMQLKVDSEWLQKNDIMDYSLLVGIHFEEGFKDEDIKYLKQNHNDASASNMDKGVSSRSASSSFSQSQTWLRSFRKKHDEPKQSDDLTRNDEATVSLTQPKNPNTHVEPVPSDGEDIPSTQQMSLLTDRESQKKEAAVEEGRLDMKFKDGQLTNGLSVFQQHQGGVRGVLEDGGDAHQIYYCGIIDMLQTYNIQKKMEHSLKVLQARGHNADGISSTDTKRYAQRFMTYMSEVLVAKV